MQNQIVSTTSATATPVSIAAYFSLAIPGNAVKLTRRLTADYKSTGFGPMPALERAISAVLALIENADDVLITDAVKADLVKEVRALLPAPAPVPPPSKETLPREEKKHPPISAPGRAVALVNHFAKCNREKGLPGVEALLRAVDYVHRLIRRERDPNFTAEQRKQLADDVRALLPQVPTERVRRASTYTAPTLELGHYEPIPRNNRGTEIKVTATPATSHEEQQRRAAAKKAERIKRAEASAAASRDVSNLGNARKRNDDADKNGKTSSDKGNKKNKKSR